MIGEFLARAYFNEKGCRRHTGTTMPYWPVWRGPMVLRRRATTVGSPSVGPSRARHRQKHMDIVRVVSGNDQT
jgi:hypothetical protein